jgi:hypothetical protein
MIRTAFVSIFWGLLMALVDVKLGRLDLAPDFIGYLFVFKGLRQLAALHGSFGTASSYALVLLAFSLVELIGMEHPLLPVIDIVFSLLMFWSIYDGIIALASASENGGLMWRASVELAAAEPGPAGSG